MFKNIQIIGHIVNLKFPYDEDIDSNGIITKNQKDIHPCLILAKETIEDINIIYVAYGTSNLENEPCSFFSGDDYLSFGLEKRTKWIISSYKILRIKIDDKLYKKYIGKITNKDLVDNINRHCNKKNILHVINTLKECGINRIPLNYRDHPSFW